MLASAHYSPLSPSLPPSCVRCAAVARAHVPAAMPRRSAPRAQPGPGRPPLAQAPADAACPPLRSRYSSSFQSCCSPSSL
eukprot:scaffold4029_cov117-Isochrysis_galbana.AAC.7